MKNLNNIVLLGAGYLAGRLSKKTGPGIGAVSKGKYFIEVDVFKAPVMKKKEVKAAPKKVAAKKVVETKTKSKTRQTGSSNLAKDKQRKAQGPGKRKSASGGVYYEYRRNRTDIPGSNV